jgi:glycerate 2-kinase
MVAVVRIRRVVAAPDKFKGTLSAAEVAAAIGHACWELGIDCTEVPMADGGDGLLDVLGGANRTSTVTGPLGDPVVAPWRLAKGTAVIEMARASGLTLVGGAEGNDAMNATTTGTGELIDHALDADAKRIIVGLGGSATTDGGFGAIRAITAIARLKRVELLVACDVTTTFVDAARVFGPQKGATRAQVEMLTRRLERLTQMFERDFQADVTTVLGGGAAGGLGGALAALGATLLPGFELVADELDLYDQKSCRWPTTTDERPPSPSRNGWSSTQRPSGCQRAADVSGGRVGRGVAGRVDRCGRGTELRDGLVGFVGAEQHEHAGTVQGASVDGGRAAHRFDTQPSHDTSHRLGDRLRRGDARVVLDDRRLGDGQGGVDGRRDHLEAGTVASSVVIRPAEPGTPLALATTTVAPSVTNGGSVVVVVVFSATALSVVSGVGSTGTPLVSPADGPSLVMLLRIRKPTMTATTASTMLIVEPIGEPPTPWRGDRRAGVGVTGASGSS